mgnify:CR=1 FL=1
MRNGFAIALAWPETLCKRAGAWYDYPLHYLKISKKGYYKVGHAAVVLIDQDDPTCHYFDFGRYHAPHGHGRVRSVKTDHDLAINKKAIFSDDFQMLLNLKEILQELYNKPSTHGDGAIYGTIVKINFDQAFDFANNLQNQEFIPYGPFLQNGTNCSRFVSSVIQMGKPSINQRLKLKFSLTISPTPIWNLKAIGGNIMCYGEIEKGVIKKSEQFEPEIIIV